MLCLRWTCPSFIVHWSQFLLLILIKCQHSLSCNADLFKNTGHYSGRSRYTNWVLFPGLLTRDGRGGIGICFLLWKSRGGLNIFQVSNSKDIHTSEMPGARGVGRVLDPMLVTRIAHWMPVNFNDSRKRWMLLLHFPLDRCYTQIIMEKSI